MTKQKKLMYNFSLSIMEKPGEQRKIHRYANLFGGDLRTGYSWYHQINHLVVYGKNSQGRIRMQLEDSYIRVSHGAWVYKYGKGYVLKPNIEPLEGEVSIQAGPDWVDISFPTQIWRGEWTSIHDGNVYHKGSGLVALSYIPKEGNDPPPFPYDPNFPSTPQQDLKLWCKSGGEIYRAKKLYVKQGGVIVPIRQIRGR